MTRTSARLPRLASAMLAGTLLLAGCAGGTSSSADNGHSTGSDASASSSTSTTHNDADVAFVSAMLPHHEGAISMAELAPGRAADPRVVDLASRIQAAQGPEIATLTGWLSDWGTAADRSGMDHGSSMDHSGMSGMSAANMAALTNASGAEFDRLFLSQMIDHHRSAVQMAEQEAADGQNADALAMAASIRDSQAAEIAEMQQLLTQLGG
jgi:uncharacterized protein (DUF305 family)